MVLTENQKKQLNNDILEYLANNGYAKTSEVFASEIAIELDQVDPEGRRLEMKWKSILTLQKKINNLEEKVAGLEEELAKGGGGPVVKANI